MKSIRHLRCNKKMTWKKQFLTKWNEQFRKDIGVYEPLINISKFFKLDNLCFSKIYLTPTDIEWFLKYDNCNHLNN